MFKILSLGGVGLALLLNADQVRAEVPAHHDLLDEAGLTMPALRKDAEGRLVVAAYRSSGTQDIALFRFLPGGEPDPSFGLQGRAAIWLGLEPTAPLHLEPAANGQWLVAGRVNLGAGPKRIGIARFAADGSLDAGFGTGGVRVLAAEGSLTLAGVAPLADGRTLVFATRDPHGDLGYGARVMRLDVDGHLDAAYGESGAREFLPLPRKLEGGYHESDFRGAFVSRVATGADGRHAILGTARASDYNWHGVLLSLLPDGEPDPSFGGLGDGFAMIPAYKVGSSWPSSYELAPGWLEPRADGAWTLILSRRSWSYLTYVTVIHADGSPDSSFSNDTEHAFPFMLYASDGFSSLVEGDRVLFTTNTGFQDRRLRIFGVAPKGALDPEFGGADGIDTGLLGASVYDFGQELGLARDASGALCVAGYTEAAFKSRLVVRCLKGAL